MRWLWDVVPIVALLVYLVTTLRISTTEARRRKQVERWTDEFLGPIETRKGIKSRRVRSLPSVFNPLLEMVGEGARVWDIVLVPKSAYMAVRSANHQVGSDHTTVLFRLDRAAPQMTVRPLPIVDGQLAENTGIEFRNDPEFMESFIVEGGSAKKIGRWLNRALRELLLDVPEVWVRTHGRTVSFTIYGPVDTEILDELVGAADAFFAEYGDVEDESLFGDGSVAAKKKNQEKDEKLVPAQGLARLKASAIDLGLYALAGAIVAAVVGVFDSFHPEALFNSPVRHVEHAWQGGWTTKGVGALVAAQTVLVALVVVQTRLALLRGSSIGNYLVGVRFVRAGGESLTFVRAVLLRSWLWLAPAIIAAAAIARPLSWRAFFANVLTWTTVGVFAATLAAIAATILQSKNGRGLHDRVAGTRAVVTAPWAGFTPAEKNKVLVVLSLAAAWVGIDFIANYFNLAAKLLK